MADEMDKVFDGVDGSEDSIVKNETSEETAETTETTETTEGKTWKDLGVDRWDGLPREQRAKELVYERQRYGKQADELGTTRKERDEALSQLNSVKSAAGVEKKVEDKLSTMSDWEKNAFFESLEKGDPREAILNLIKPNLGLQSKEDIQKLIEESVNDALHQYDGYSQVSSVQRTRPEYVEHEPYIEVLTKAENFGNTRSYEDMLDFSILQKSNSTLGDVVFDLMKRHSSMSFNECKELAELRMGAKKTNETTKDELRETVKGIEGGVKKGAKKKGSETEKIMTMDDAFGPD